MIDLKSSLNNFAFTLQNYLFGAVKLTKNSDLINTSIVDMKLNLIQEKLLLIQVVELV